MSRAAQAAWDAYAEAVGGKTFDDKPLPSWEELGDRQKAGWQAAAEAVLVQYGHSDDLESGD